MPTEKKPFEEIDSILKREEIALSERAKNHHIPSAFEGAVAHALKTLSRDSCDGFTAEGIAAGKLGIPVEWCPYIDEPPHERSRAKAQWLDGHRMGRIYREATPPSMPVLERLAIFFESRLRKNDRDVEQRLVAMVAKARKRHSELASELDAAQKRIKQLEGQYGPEIDRPTMMLRFLVQPITHGGKPQFRAFCPGLNWTKAVAPTKEAAMKQALETFLSALNGVVDEGREFNLEWVKPEEGE